MSRLGGWFRAAVKDEDTAAVSAKERQNLVEALEHTRLIMNDDIDRAHELLKLGDSSFHRLGTAVTFFLRSVLGMEKSVMLQTAEMLAECEAKCWDDLKAAQRRGREGSVYPAGAEYELVRAETQLMGAVVGVLHESVVEAMKSFLKLRKAYITLDALVAVEAKAKVTGTGSATASVTAAVAKLNVDGQENGSQTPGMTGSSVLNSPRTEDSESEIFVDAKQAQTPIEPLTEATSMTASQELLDNPISQLAPPDEPVFEDPLDIFIYSGANMCFGILTLILTLVPPSFARILSVVGFTGDRLRGVKMLWKSAQHDNTNGALAGMMLLAFYNGLLGTVDILPHEDDFDAEAETVGPPREKCRLLLATMRQRYPDSRLWRVEEARQYTRERNVAKAIETLTTGAPSRMKQVTALNDFELALDAMINQNWVLMREAFLRCLENNEWSPAMYYFLAGCASLELYRDAYHAGDLDEARREKAKAEEFFRKAPTVTGGKKLLARKLPMEDFIQMRSKRWEERASEMGIDLADAIGMSPGMEMSYFWNGTRRMGPGELERGEECCSWTRCTNEKLAARLQQEGGSEVDELGVWALCLSAIRRSQGRRDEARALLTDYIIKYDRYVHLFPPHHHLPKEMRRTNLRCSSTFKGSTKNDHLLPCATYELGVIAWDECCNPPSSTTSKGAEEGGTTATSSDILAYRKQKLEECEVQLEKVRIWEAYSLDSRVGLRVQSGLETLKWFRNKMGWAA